LKGKIKKLIQDRGFGFITAENGRDIFFHRSALAGKGFDALEEGTSVEFAVKAGPKGLQAINVKKTE